MGLVEKGIITYVILLGFILFWISVGGTNYFLASDPSLTWTISEPPHNPTAWEGLWYNVTYVIGNIGFFFSLLFFSANYSWLGYLIFSPMAILVGIYIVKVIRGHG